MEILIIEPDYILAKEIKRAFVADGFKVQISTNAQDAISTIDKKLPSAVVLELQLSGHSGVEFLHEFRSYEDWSNIPVFVYSKIPEYALGADKKTWDSFGVVRYFYKPKTTFNQLMGAVKGYLTSEQST